MPKLICLIVMATLLSTAPSPSHAEPRTGTADEAEMAFQLGAQAYLAGKTRDALAHFFVSQRLAPNRKVVFNIALCFEQLGEAVAAYRYYQEHIASASDPNDPDSVPSREALERLRPKLGLIRITSRPEGANIYLGRKDLGAFGVTPLLVPVKPGDYQVLLEADGHRPFESAKLAVTLGSIVTVDADMAPLTGTLAIVGQPEGAVVTLGGKPIGTLPFEGIVPAGRGTVEVHKPGWTPRSVVYEVPTDGRQGLDVSLARQVGTLVISCDEIGALIRVNGQPAGFAPAVLDRVPVGDVDVTVSLEGFRPWARKVALAEGDKLELDAVLAVRDDVQAASRFIESAGSAPASVTLVPATEIAAFDYGTLADALRGVRGFTVSDDLIYPTAGVRGFGPLGDYSNRFQLQIDGHILNDGWLGQAFLSHDAIAGLEPFERLEVVRGPGSVLYGTGALFGVLNLVPADGFTNSGRAGVSMLGPHTTRLWAEQKLALPELDGGVSVYGGLVYEAPHRFRSPAQVGSEDHPDGVANDVGETLGGSIFARAKTGDFTTLFFFNQRERQPPNGAYDVLYGDSRLVVFDRRSFAEVRFQRPLSDTLELTAQVSWDHYSYYADLPYAEDDGGLLSERFVGHSISAQARTLWRPNPEWQLTTGIDWQYHVQNDAFGEAVDIEDGTYLDERHPWQSFALYALGGWEPNKTLGVQLGLRYDGRIVSDLADAEGNTEDRYAGALSPRLAVRIRPDEHTILKVMGGTAFRAPSVYELTYNDGGETQIPSPDLDPETIYTAEIELVRSLGDDLDLVVGVFLSSLTNYIEVNGEGTEDDPIFLTNQDREVWSAGFEAELQHELSRGIFFSLSYAFQDTRTGALFDGDELPNAPAHQLAAKLLLPIVRPELSLTNRLTLESGRIDRRGERTDFGVLWDIGVHGQLPAVSAEYSLTVRNALGWEYETPLSALVPDVRYTLPGPTLTADLTFFW